MTVLVTLWNGQTWMYQRITRMVETPALLVLSNGVALENLVLSHVRSLEIHSK